MDFNIEWEFIVSEMNKSQREKLSVIEREILFAMQILLVTKDSVTFSKVKEYYLKSRNRFYS
ncbi:hypothetical protein MASR1M45_28970 [Candidatus Kapaibacterium sp.]